MSMTGWQFERHVADILRANSFCVEVTPGSADWGVDLIVDFTIAVQVKFWSEPVSHKAVQEVYTGMAMHHCSEAWVITNHTYTEAAKTLAERNGVWLLGGAWLNFMEENPDPLGHDLRHHIDRFSAHCAAEREKLREKNRAKWDALLTALGVQSGTGGDGIDSVGVHGNLDAEAD